MKKVLVISAILFLILNLTGFGQSITVTKPNSSTKWTSGGSGEIAWTKSGSMDSHVKIRLFNTSLTQKIANISDSISQTDTGGNFTWSIPSSIQPGTYVVLVKTLDNDVYNNSVPFEILAGTKKIFAKSPVMSEHTNINKGVINLMPDLTVSAGGLFKPAGQKTYFKIIIKNIGLTKTPKTAMDRLVVHYHGPNGTSPPELIMNLIFTGIPKLDPGEEFFHMVDYTFQKAGKYVYTVYVNRGEQKRFNEKTFANNFISPSKWHYILD